MSPLRRGLPLLCWLIALTVVTGACVGLPDDGPVEVTPEPESEVAEGFPYAPAPPQPGQTPEEVVSGFFDAMTAVPMDTSIARKFLTTESRNTWRPDRRTVVYGEASNPQGTGTIRTTLRNVDRLDSRGRWLGRLPSEQRRLDFSMVYQNGSWRIDSPPDALIVTDTWFRDNFRPVTLYFFDPTARVLVPEPTYVPARDRLASTLVRGLLRGTSPRLQRVSRTFLPDGLSGDLSVPVSSEGLAEVRLHGDTKALDSASIRLLAVQLAWTLRQDPSVQRLRITIDGAPVRVPGYGTTFSVGIGGQFDPTGVSEDEPMYGVRDDRMVRVDGSFVAPVEGPFGTRGAVTGPVSVNLDGTTAVAVDGGGSRLLAAPLSSTRGRMRELIAGHRLLPPAWDVRGRAWVLDRPDQGARIRLVAGGRVRTVRIPEVTGHPDVRDFLVSRDGSRLLALLGEPGSDRVVQTRLDTEATGIGTRTVLQGRGEQLDLSDLSWRAPTEFAVVNHITRTLAELRTISVDGSPELQTVDPSTVLARGARVRVVSSPRPTDPVWIERPRGRLELVAPETGVSAPPAGIRGLRYPG